MSREDDATQADLRALVARIFEHREYERCWYYDGPDWADCGNWPSCDPECPLAQLRTKVGMEPDSNGDVSPRPARP